VVLVGRDVIRTLGGGAPAPTVFAEPPRERVARSPSGEQITRA
jgi:hypothetical protein